MSFMLPDKWVWDLWLADDGDLFHMYFLQAPRALGDPELRHRNATVGHATSRDLVTWEPHGTVLSPGGRGTFDETATWTGSVVRASDGSWMMFYTGSSFHAPDSNANTETIGAAASRDLFTWTKLPGPVLTADPTWYEKFGTSSWPEEAWRDPWVFPDPDGSGWHMLVTARANAGKDAGRGVIGHAISADLVTWRAMPPLSEPQQGFDHLEVPQAVDFDGHPMLLFCCNSARLTDRRKGQRGGIWAAPAAGPAGPFAIERSTLLAPESLYAGRMIRNRTGRWVLLAFQMEDMNGAFAGSISDPIPLAWDAEAQTIRIAGGTA